MKRYKLADIVFKQSDFLSDHPDILYRARDMASFDEASGVFSFSGEVDFCTYFNAISVAKWKQYTGIAAVRLHIETKGDPCRIVTRGMSLKGEAVTSSVGTVFSIDETSDFHTTETDIPFPNETLSGFTLTSKGTTQVRNAYYYTFVDEERIHPVKLALCTTTFKKEEFVIPNIARIKEEVLGSNDDIANSFHMFVVDNGCTLDADALSDDGVTICPNKNVGGAGGFARGMLEALESSEDFTHVILMDDDVRVSPESFHRVFALLSIVKPSYERAFINGAMLEMEHPNLMFEDVSYVRASGGYEKIKPDLYIDRIDDLVRNESYDVEVKNAYGAWWFSCIPVSVIRENGLPLPLFVRCDDIEYGIRCQPTYMTMDGICVWHQAFGGRFRAAVDCYQYTRNMLITIALHNCSSESAFVLRYWRVFRIYLRTMNYDAAELWLDGLEDYLKGPDFLMTADGAEIMKKNSAKNEKLEPIDELDQKVIGEVDINDDWLSGEDTRNAFFKVLETVPHDRHYFPKWMLSDKPAMVTPSGSITPWQKTAMRNTLVAVDEEREHAHIRTMDRDRYKELVDRYHSLRFAYLNRRIAVAERYRERFRTMTSAAFWKKYLDLKETR